MTRYAPSTPSSVLPDAMPSDVAMEPAVGRFATKAAMNTPRHMRTPKMRNAASAMPVGGHTPVALPFRYASPNPNFALAHDTAAPPARARVPPAPPARPAPTH